MRNLNFKIMVITNNKVLVTMDMLNGKNMCIFTSLLLPIQVGVPVDPLDASRGLRWKDLHELKEEDFDSLEDYFLNQQNAKTM